MGSALNLRVVACCVAAALVAGCVEDASWQAAGEADDGPAAATEIAEEPAEQAPDLPRGAAPSGAPCLTSADCLGDVPRFWCDKRRGACVECYLTSHCPDGSVCSSGACIAAGECSPCPECDTSADCPAPWECVAGVCRAPAVRCTSRLCADIGQACDGPTMTCTDCEW